MTLVRSFEEDDYIPEFGILMMRDAAHPGPGHTLPPVAAWLEEDGVSSAQPCGTFARAGAGWFEAAAAGHRDHAVRLELHDSAPPLEAGWDDVLETPYRSETGSVYLTQVTGSPDQPGLRLDSPGSYRVRVARREPGDRHAVWCLQFWPEPATPEPPRRLLRSTLAVGRANSGWFDLFDFQIRDLSSIVAAAAREAGGSATSEQIEQWAARHCRPLGWLDEPVWSNPAPRLPTGHADLDEAARRQHESVVADTERRYRELAGIAGQLGIAAPRSRREVLALLVAAGLLEVDDPGGQSRYRRAPEPPHVLDVLDLPAAKAAALRSQDEAHRFICFASDVVAVVMWAPESPYPTTVSELAERLLASEDHVRQTLAYTVKNSLLAVEGDGAALRLTVLSGQTRGVSSGVVPLPEPGPPWGDPDRGKRSLFAGRDDRFRPPWGKPPRAGLVTENGEVVVWRDGVAVTLARLPGLHPQQVLETAFGIVINHSGQVDLVRHDGTIDTVAGDIAPRVAVSEDGRHLAVAPYSAVFYTGCGLRLVDLADGSHRAMPWNVDREVVVSAVHGGAVYFHGQPADEPAGPAGNVAMRWTPGQPPERLGYGLRRIDPLTGAVHSYDTEPGALIIWPDGARKRVLADADLLVPGAGRLCRYRHSPPAVTLFDVAAGAADPQIHWLPRNSEVNGPPVWEDPDHVLVPMRGWDHDLDAAAVRLDVRTGEFERVPVAEGAGYRPILVQPLLRGGPAQGAADGRLR